MAESLITLWNVVLVLLGFGFVIFWHELGHFVTARWAGIRVLEFAVGFGPAVCSYRKGIGLRRGSTNPEFARRLAEHRARAGEGGGETTGTVVTDAGVADTERDHVVVEDLPGVSPTEYRLNWIPLGGYVRMLGQEDVNPSATSGSPDSYTQVPVWKRMIVVSGGVVMNVILAAILFVVVYSVGLESSAPAIAVDERTPAYDAGLRTGDVVRAVNGERVEVFQDLLLKVGLSKKGAPLEVTVHRPGAGEKTFGVEPRYNKEAEIRAIGVWAMPGATIKTPADDESRAALERMLSLYGLGGVEPGMTLAEVGGAAVDPVSVAPWGEVVLPTALLEAAAASDGAPIPVVFVDEQGGRVEAVFEPRREYDVASVRIAGEFVGVRHVLGLTAPLMVRDTSDAGAAAGLLPGDVFVRLGGVEWPNAAEGIGAIRAKAGGTIGALVLRGAEVVSLELPVSAQGTVGFSPDEAFDLPYLASPPTPAPEEGDEAPDGGADGRRHWVETGSITGGVRAGAMVTSVNGVGVSSLGEVRSALLGATYDALASGAGASVELGFAGAGAGEAERVVEWALDAAAVEHLHGLGWTGEGMLGAMAPAMILQVGSGPVHSVRLGLRETQRMLTRVYLTLGRLADGSVRPQQLKGPVGITHIGSRVARDGWIRLLFFIGLISANLAVLNFLPLPIVDGGLFLMLVYEGITKKPVPVGVQNALTLIGLVVLAGVFLFVTTNDVLNLFG